MDPLHRQAIVQGVLGTLFFVVLIFWPAGTFDYWQGWLFLGIFAAATVGFTVYLAIYDRPLLERRLKGGPQHEREWSQKIIVSLVLLAFFAWRHPMYAGAIWLFVGMPLALGSWWSLGLIVPFMPVLLWRLLDEEKILQRDLPGYTDYMRRVRFRLVPFVW